MREAGIVQDVQARRYQILPCTHMVRQNPRALLWDDWVWQFSISYFETVKGIGLGGVNEIHPSGIAERDAGGLCAVVKLHGHSVGINGQDGGKGVCVAGTAVIIDDARTWFDFGN